MTFIISTMHEAYIEALEGAFDLEALKAARREVAIALATAAENTLEISLKRSDGRETSAIRVTSYQERMAFLQAAKTIIDRAEGRGPGNSGIKTTFAHHHVDP